MKPLVDFRQLHATMRNMTKREFTAIYQKRGKRYVGWVEEIPGVNTQGRTKQEVRENLQEALGLILETNRKLAKSQQRESITREPLHIGIRV